MRKKKMLKESLYKHRKFSRLILSGSLNGVIMNINIYFRKFNCFKYKRDNSWKIH